MSHGRNSVLLVDDDPNDIEVALRAFRRHRLDMMVKVVDNGAHALEYLRAAERGQAPLPRVILLDLKMPGIDGVDVARAVRASKGTQHMPIVMISSSRQSSDVEASYRSGANSFVVKRVEPDRPGEYLVDVAKYWLGLNQET